MKDVLLLFNIMLVSLKVKTWENYGAGLLRYHQIFNTRKMLENYCMPAPDFLLAAFIASRVGKTVTTTAQNWPADIHFWHNLHRVPWYGSGLLRSATAGLSKVVPKTSKRPHCPPVILEHTHVLFYNLDLSNSFDISVFAITLVAFWCCCKYNLGLWPISELSSWWNIESILPLFVTASFKDSHILIVHSSLDSFSHKYK